MKNRILIIKVITAFLLSLTWISKTDSQCVYWLDSGSPDHTEVFTYGSGSILHICGDLSSGNYDMSIRTCDFYETGDFTNSTIEFDLNNTLGWDSERFGQDQCPYAYVVSQTATTLHLRTYVFHLDNHYSTFWRPCEIEQSHIRYRVCKSIPPVTFWSNMPLDPYINEYRLALHGYGYLTPVNTTNVNCYLWCLMKCASTNPCENLPFNYHGIQSVTPNNGSTFGLYNSAFDGYSCQTDLNQPLALNLFEKLTMGNQGGCTQQTAISYPIQPLTSNPIGGCPWLWVLSDSGLFPENNAFYKSEFSEFYGNDITDLYVFQNKPKFDSNNNFIVELAEATNDYTMFDQVQMYSVDHPVGTKMGVTESGDIVIYYTDEIGSTNYATLNATREITPLIQYGYNGEKIVKGESSDSIYAHYDSSGQKIAKKLHKTNIGKMYGSTFVDSMALIGRLGHNPDMDYPINPAVKDWAGNMNIYSGESYVTKQFARREVSSDIIIPFGNIDAVVDYIDINFTNDYEVTYFSVVPVSYYGYTQNSLSLVSAEHNVVGDISSALANKDNNYAYLDSTCVITLQFQDETTPEEGWIRDYVIQYDGQYTIPDGDGLVFNKGYTIQNMKVENTNPYSFNLHTNYPNPFNPMTTIKYSIPKDAKTTLKVYDALGKLVISLVNEYKNAGEYVIEFNGENYPSGVYFYVLESSDFVSTKKMVLIK